MRNYCALVCLVAAAPAIWAQGTPKGLESGLHQRVNVIESDAISSLVPDAIAGYEVAADGTIFTVIHIRNAGAEAVRIQFENIRLPEKAALLVYGAGSAPAWVYNRGSEESAVVAGESVFVEIQCGVECPSDLPFDITEVSAAPMPDGEFQGSPQTNESAERHFGNFRGVDVEYEIRDGLAIMEGDIILGPAHEMLPAEGGKLDREKQAVGLTSSSFRWPGGRIPYAIDYTLPDKARVTNAISHWNAMLGGTIKFVPRTNESVYLRVVRGSSCSAVIGMGWVNTMYLGDACTTGNVIHELGHTVGLYHEHVREDRNKYVRIRTENISSSLLSQFAQMTNITDDIGTYDFNSIMHYGAYANSMNGRMTIETIPAGIPIGQRVRLSSGDIAGVRKMYGAGYTVPTTTTPAYDAEPAPAPVVTTAAVAITIAANPVTEQIVVDGNTYKGSVTLQWAPGSTHTISAPGRSASNGSSATFVKWSDNGASTHTVTTGSAATIYTAHFSIKYLVSVTSSNPAAGTVSVSPQSSTGYHAANSALSLTATPGPGYCFSGWIGLISGTAPQTTLTVSKPYTITAQFSSGVSSLGEQFAYVKAPSGTYSVAVTASSGCSWKAESHATWIHVSTASRTGSASLQYTVDANTSGTNRIGGISIAGRSFYVIQYTY